MTNEEQTNLRLMLREEVNAAVYASEQRIGERIDQLAGYIGRLDTRVDRLEGGQRELQAEVSKVKITLSEVVSIFDDTSRVINDMQASQRAIEARLEDNLVGLRHDMQKLIETVHTFAREFIHLNTATNERITWHERAPINETHPRPHSTA
jgi:hypothetical protein